MTQSQDAHPINQLRQERIRRSWRQQDLAELLGTTVATIKRWEHSRQQPSQYFQVKLYDLFGKSAMELGLLFEEPSSTDPASEDATPFSLPFLRNPYFTGRKQLLAHLYTLLTRQPARAALTQAYSVHGLGGVGKTQLAVEYAHQYRSAYRAVLWMQAETQASLMASFGQIASALHLPEYKEADDPKLVTAVLTWLNTHSGWLLICDNVEDLSLLKPFLPTSDQGALLFTSRLPSIGNLAQPLALPPLTIQEGAAFLLARASREEDATGDVQEQEAAQMIADLMGGLPLALEQAGAYIQASQCQLSDYLRLFQQMPDYLLDIHEPFHDHPLSVTRTFLIAFDHVAQRNPVAGDLLTVCAFLAPESIPEMVFLEGASSLGLGELTTSRLAFEEAIKVLLAYSLIQRSSSTHTITVHRLVQAVLLAHLSQEKMQMWRRLVVEAMDRLFPTNHETQKDYLALGEQLLPHAQACLALDAHGESVDVPSIRLRIHIAAYLLQRGRFSEAETFIARAKQHGERLLEAEQPLLAESIVGLARVYREQGRYSQAESLYEQAMSIYEETLGAEHPDMATCLNSLGALYGEQGKYQEAIACFERAVPIIEHALGPEHLQIVASLNGLGNILSRQGKYQQAIQYYEQALHILEQAFGTEHPQAANLLNNLGVLYTDQGQYHQAALYLEHALHIREQVLGTEHPYTAQVLHNLGLLYESLGEYSLAASSFLRALDIWEQQLDVESADLAHSVASLGDVYRQQGCHEQAEAYYQRALHIYGQNNPLAISPLGGLAYLRMAQGRDEQAEVIFQQALLLCQQHLSPLHPHVAEILHNLAHLQKVQGNITEALSLYQQALAIREQVYGTHHPKTEATQEAMQRLSQENHQAET
jgi:tetratricopeptide (TPR) repeat protein/transcriptional regulator with XRE-family HTH domain